MSIMYDLISLLTEEKVDLFVLTYAACVLYIC